ncbi:MAG TPA: DsbE family thiol:disulfide interchange protein [Woeseiaceae bacterium]|nr:DsbE family thiol:disulfide interchange protein [Woeseiaceae bacterium]
MKLRFLVPIVLFAVLLPILIYGLSRDPSIVPSPYLGKPAPAMDLPNIENPDERVTSADYAGEVALVNIWATWCVGCRQEHAFLVTLAERGEIPIFGLNWRDQRQPALTWLRQLGNPYVAVGFDPDGSAGIDWGAYGAPETFLIGRNGRVLQKHAGPLNEAIWQQKFVPLIEGAGAD